MAAVELSHGSIVEPVLDHAAMENARLANHARVVLVRSGTAVTVDTIADTLGKTVSTVRRWVARQRDAQRLFTVSHNGQMLIPTVQLDEVFSVNEVTVNLVQRCLAHGMDGWAIWHWFQTPNTWLDAEIPADRVRAGDTAALDRALDGLFQE